MGGSRHSKPGKKTALYRATILERFVDHFTRGFTPEFAKHFAELPEPYPEFQARLDELAARTNERTLTDEEREEYDKYVEYMGFVAYMTLRARSRAGTSAP